MRWWSFGVGLATSVIGWSVANYYEFVPKGICADCMAFRGTPFALYRDDGFADGAGILWLGLLGDVAVVVVTGCALAVAVARFLRK